MNGIYLNTTESYAFLLSIFIKYTLSIQNYNLHTHVSKVPFIETKNTVHHTGFAYLYNVFSFGGRILERARIIWGIFLLENGDVYLTVREF